MVAASIFEIDSKLGRCSCSPQQEHIIETTSCGQPSLITSSGITQHGCGEVGELAGKYLFGSNLSNSVPAAAAPGRGSDGSAIHIHTRNPNANTSALLPYRPDSTCKKRHSTKSVQLSG